MPWRLSGQGRSVDIFQWGPHRLGDDLDSRDWTDPKIVPDQSQWPLFFEQRTGPAKLPDFMGRGGGSAYWVSRRFKELVERMDPVSHVYVPLKLKLTDGRMSEGEYFLFKFSEFLDSIDAARSEVHPIYGPEKKTFFYSMGLGGRVSFYRNIVGGRHIWADKYLKNDFFCSDEFMKELKRLKMQDIQAYPADLVEPEVH